MKRINIFLISIICAGSIQAQTINIELSKFGGEEYVWILNQGTKQDTISNGKLDVNGKTRIMLPAKYAGYSGMSSFALIKGGGLDLIVNNENFTASSSSDTPNLDNIVFTGSPENTFLVQQYKEQSKVKAQLKLLQDLQGLYKPNDVFYTQATAELKKVTLADTKQQTAIKNSPLYAARFLQMREYFDGLTNYWQKTPQEVEGLRHEAVNRINDDLYTSSMWKYTLDYWSATYRDAVKNDSIFTADAITLLRSQKSTDVLNELGNNLIGICEQNNLEKPKMQIAFALYKSGRLQKPTGNLAQTMAAFSASPGNIAPDIDLGSGFKLSSLSASQYIIIFYETGCGHCDDELIVLRQHYRQLREKGIVVISIGSDTSPAISEVSTNSFPWSEKLCDFKGFEGINFKNYGIIGTPTIFVLDKDKKITGRYAKVEQSGLIESKK